MDFQELYDSYAPDVYRFSLWLSGDVTEAEDVTSETFVRAWGRRDDIRTETLKAYMFTIARNVYLERRRKDRYHDVLTETHKDPAPGPDRTAESRAELHRVEQVLRGMHECDRTAFILRFRHDLPYAEIARVLGLSLTHAKVKVHRVRKKLLADRIKREVS